MLMKTGEWDEALSMSAEIPATELGTKEHVSLLLALVQFHVHKGEAADAEQLLARFDRLDTPRVEGVKRPPPRSPRLRPQRSFADT